MATQKKAAKVVKKPAKVALKDLKPKKKPAMKSVAPQTVACKVSPPSTTTDAAAKPAKL